MRPTTPRGSADGALALDAIDNLALVLGYSFTPAR